MNQQQNHRLTANSHRGHRRRMGEWLKYFILLSISSPLVLFVCLFVLRPKSTAVVMAVHLPTLFPGQAWTSGYPLLCAHIFACKWQQPFLNDDSAEGRRMTVEIISWSLSTKVWDWTGIELVTRGSAVKHASVARHVTDCATRPLVLLLLNH